MLDFSSPFCSICEVLNTLQKVPHTLHNHLFRSRRKSTWVLHVPCCRILSWVKQLLLVWWLQIYRNFYCFSWVKTLSRRATVWTKKALTCLQHLLDAVSTTASSWPQRRFYHRFWKHGANAMYDNTCRPVRAGWPEGSLENRAAYCWNHGRGKLHLHIHDTTEVQPGWGWVSLFHCHHIQDRAPRVLYYLSYDRFAKVEDRNVSSILAKHKGTPLNGCKKWQASSDHTLYINYSRFRIIQASSQ